MSNSYSRLKKYRYMKKILMCDSDDDDCQIDQLKSSVRYKNIVKVQELHDDNEQNIDGNNFIEEITCDELNVLNSSEDSELSDKLECDNSNVISSLQQVKMNSLPNMEDKVRRWALNNKIDFNVVSEMLTLLRSEGYTSLPSTARQLLGYKHTTHSKRCGVVLSKTDDLKQAERRLEKTSDENVVKTECESRDTEQSQEPIIISNEEAQRLLNQVHSIRTPKINKRVNEEEGDLEHNSKKYIKRIHLDHDSLMRGLSSDEDHNSLMRGLSSDDEQENEEKCPSVSLINEPSLNGIEKNDIAELKSFITDQVDSLHKKINRVHRSLIYDQNKKFEEIKKLITLNAPAVEEDQNTASITAVMPIKSIKKFLEFEDELSSDVAKQQSLKRIFQVVTAGSENYVNDIKKIISQIIHPAVQIQYSAAGRVCKGLSKRKYISTSSYKCMIDFLSQKYVNSKIPLKFVSITSEYLSGAGDRNGQRANR